MTVSLWICSSAATGTGTVNTFSEAAVAWTDASDFSLTFSETAGAASVYAARST